VSASAFGQSSNAILSGTVSDAAKALIPGVSITATNTATGIVSMAVTNETGTYNIPSLLPGVYTVSAVLPGFQTRTYTEVRLGNAAQVRLNFTLEVAGLSTTVEVTVSADRLLLESTSSVGAVLPEQAVRTLPTVGVMGSDVLDLVRTLPGISLADPRLSASDLTNRSNNTIVAGVSAANVQVQRDGVDATQGVRWPTGISSNTVINPDLVGEVRMILAPVDAEVGRGNSQIQIQTRSGTNQFRGAAVWNVRNSALDPNQQARTRRTPHSTLDKCERGHGEYGGTDREKQDVLLRALERSAPGDTQSHQPHRAHAVRPAGHLPVLRQLEQRQRVSGHDRRRHSDDRRGGSTRQSEGAGHESERNPFCGTPACSVRFRIPRHGRIVRMRSFKARPGIATGPRWIRADM
jgi:hypothetical protein